MPDIRVAVVVPTLAADHALEECLRSLAAQTLRDFELVVVDNSGAARVRRMHALPDGAVLIENGENLGFGAAVNQGIARTSAPLVATLNDDAVARPDWLEKLAAAMDARPRAGMCASQVRLSEGGMLDSAGMLLCGDGSSKQRGQSRPPSEFSEPADVLFPSGSAALYRRDMLDRVGGFDERFFLYCEDSDLGLRARWAGWTCAYVPEAVVEHRYSHSAGAVSPLKAFLVERNRLFLVVRNFPAPMLAAAPLVSLARYFWHLVEAGRGRGSAGRFHREGNSWLRLPWLVLKAHAALAAALPRLLRERAAIRGQAAITAREFRELAGRHSISAREVAGL